MFGIYNQVNIFKTKTNLKINKPNRRDIFSTNYNIKLMHILKDILYSNTPPQAKAY